MLVAEAETLDQGRASQERMDGCAERAGSFAMDDPNLQNASGPTLLEIGWDQFTQISRPKRMQVQLARNWQTDGFIFGCSRLRHGGVGGGRLGSTPVSGAGAGVDGGWVGAAGASKGAAGVIAAAAGATGLDFS